MIDWHQHITLPDMRTETHFDGRSLRCFTDRPASFYAMFAQAAASYPQQEALACHEQRWTYQQLDTEINRIANGLAARGLQAGERVVMFISNRAEFVTVLFALQKLGVIAVPVGTREQAPGLAYIIRQCGAAGIVFDEDLADRLPDEGTAPALRLRISTGNTEITGRTDITGTTSAASTTGVGADTLDGGDGSDVVDYSTSVAPVIVNLALNSATGGDAQGDILLNVEGVIGTSGADTLIGNNQDNTWGDNGEWPLSLSLFSSWDLLVHRQNN
jgi:hypothetical protein